MRPTPPRGNLTRVPGRACSGTGAVARTAKTYHPTGDTTMKWETPSACDLRFGFEITMYIATR